MTTVRVVDPELVVHVFAPLAGPGAEEAYARARRLWLDCRLLLGMAHPVPDLPQHLPAALDGLPGGGEVVLAAQERTGADFQAIARRVDDVLNLSVILSSRDPRRPDWTELIRRWVTVAAPWPTQLTCAHFYQAKIEGGAPGDLDAELARTLADGLPMTLPEGWWAAGVRVTDDLVIYEPVEPGSPGSTLVLARAELSAELNAWTWSDGGPGLPPAARRLLRPSPGRAAAPPPVRPAAVPTTDLTRRVLVCTSDAQVRERMHTFLRQVGLRPVERTECVEAIGNPRPAPLEVMSAGLQLAQAVIVVATPDEPGADGRLHPSQELVLQAGYAMALTGRKTILLVAGDPALPVGMRDGTGLNDSPETKMSITMLLKLAGCEPDTTGTAWLAPGLFLGLDAYDRGQR